MKPVQKNPVKTPAKDILPQPGTRCLAGGQAHTLQHISAHVHTLVHEFREGRDEQKLAEYDRQKTLVGQLKAMEGRLMKAIQEGDIASNSKLAATLKASSDQLEAAVAANQP